MENAARRPDNSNVEGVDPEKIFYCKYVVEGRE
jgi:hypothetical protein